MDDSKIAYIHNNKRAKKGYKYRGKDGKLYIGLESGRLKLLDPETSVESIKGLAVNNYDPANPVLGIAVDGITITGQGTPLSPLVASLQPVNVDGITVTGDGTSANPLVATGALGLVMTKTLVTSTPYTIVPVSGYNIYHVDATLGNIIINFPTAVGNTAWYVIKKIDSSANTVMLDPNGMETLDGQSTQTIRFQNTSVDIYSDNSNLFIA